MQADVLGAVDYIKIKIADQLGFMSFVLATTSTVKP